MAVESSVGIEVEYPKHTYIVFFLFLGKRYAMALLKTVLAYCVRDLIFESEADTLELSMDIGLRATNFTSEIKELTQKSFNFIHLGKPILLLFNLLENRI